MSEPSPPTPIKPMRIGIMTLFPQMVSDVLNESILGRAAKNGLIIIDFANPRDFAYDRHRTVDDSPFGGSPGMLLKPEPVALAAESLQLSKEAKWLITDPTGTLLTQPKVRVLSQETEIGIFCGHYEGIDQRVAEFFNAEKISIGNYILTGGEIAAIAITDAVVRCIPDVLGNEESLEVDSFSSKWEGQLSPPAYTRPRVWRGLEVPEQLINGNHKEIEKWGLDASKPIAPEEESQV